MIQGGEMPGTQVEASPMKAGPLLKWAGGKRQLADAVDGLFGGSAALPHTYVEPFAGSAAVYFYRWSLGRFREVQQVILSDTCGSLINFYQRVQADWAAVVSEIALLPAGEGWREQYEVLRHEFNNLNPGIRQAALFWWLNKACFNGLWRTNGGGKFNVPAGDRREIPAPGVDAFRTVALALDGVELHTRSALEVLPSGWFDIHKAQVYLDPPYWSIAADSFTEYSDRFVAGHHLALVGHAKRIARAGGRVVLSNADVPALRALLDEVGGADVSEVPVRRSVGASSETRKVVQELLIRF